MGRIAQGDAYISDLYRTILDAAHRPRLVGGAEVLTEAFVAAAPHLKPDILIAYARRLGYAAALRRLGSLADTLVPSPLPGTLEPIKPITADLDKARLAEFGATVDQHGKMSDVILYFGNKSWLLLIESVTSHGPVDANRHNELASLFKDASPSLVYVTAFPDRSVMAQYLNDIPWETEVWCADALTHLIHFNGEKFLGLYENNDD